MKTAIVTLCAFGAAISAAYLGAEGKDILQIGILGVIYTGMLFHL